ncbi:MAG: carboxypeptidase regulatory-like domain-containing protein [Anaerolineales bacterium]|nr:carboxypeptidase regulatory-like domain-containing protein [Anaerolineales bacterium]
MKVFVIDVSRCNGCYNCQIACKDEHVGNDWTPYAKPQPDTGQFWLKLNEKVHGSVPKVKMSYVPILCMHCEKAPCMDNCHPNAIYRREDGLVLIDVEKCTGCMNCVDDCPYGVIYYNEELKLAQKCTGCAHLLDQGWKVPRCVDACATDALRFGEEEEFKELIAGAHIMHENYGTSPRVYYLNMPKKFIAGTIYDPDMDEVLIGAELTLQNEATEEVFKVKTDNFGDFWFKDLDVGDYSLWIEMDGYLTKTMQHINTLEDKNVGDIALSKELKVST